MNTVVWKFPLPFFRRSKRDTCVLSVPAGAVLLDVQFQSDGEEMIPTSWWLCDPKEPAKTEFEFRMVGTGWPPDPELASMEHNGTIQHGAYVWHIFSRPL